MLHQLDVLDAGVGDVALALPDQAARDHDLMRIEAIGQREILDQLEQEQHAGRQQQPALKSSQPPATRGAATDHGEPGPAGINARACQQPRADCEDQRQRMSRCQPSSPTRPAGASDGIASAAQCGRRARRGRAARRGRRAPSRGSGPRFESPRARCRPCRPRAWPGRSAARTAPA